VTLTTKGPLSFRFAAIIQLLAVRGIAIIEMRSNTAPNAVSRSASVDRV
jgi:hypothetical protein